MEDYQDKENEGKVGLRFNNGKLPVDLVPVCWIKGLAEVMKFGATKYATRNWELGMKWSIPYGCAMRHLMAWFEGESYDQESGLHHLLHAAWNCLAAYFYETRERFKSYDDRPDHQIGVSLPDIDSDCDTNLAYRTYSFMKKPQEIKWTTSIKP